jgi:hypothetical protein
LGELPPYILSGVAWQVMGGLRAARMTLSARSGGGSGSFLMTVRTTCVMPWQPTVGAGGGLQPRQCAITARNRRVSMTDLARASKASKCSGLDRSAIRSLVMAISLPSRARPAAGLHAYRCSRRGASRGGDERIDREASTGERPVHRLARRLRAPWDAGTCLSRRQG